MMDVLASEPGSQRAIRAKTNMAPRSVATYAKILAERGLLKPEVGDGDNGQYIILYRMTDKGRAFMQKLNEVMEVLNPKIGL